MKCFTCQKREAEVILTTKGIENLQVQALCDSCFKLTTTEGFIGVYRNSHPDQLEAFYRKAITVEEDKQ